MIFQHTLENVLNGSKTQTSRLWKANWEMGYNGSKQGKSYDAVYSFQKEYLQSRGYVNTNYRLQYHVGKTLAIQPARGKKAVGRIRITSLERRDIRKFTMQDIQREGFQSANDLYLTWLEMHNPTRYKMCLNAFDANDLRTRIHNGLATCHDALVIGFELIEGGKS